MKRTFWASVLLLLVFCGTLHADYIPYQVTSGAIKQRIERATVTAGASSCVVGTNITQSGSWITACTRNSTGDFTMTIATGVFSVTPTCSVSVFRGLANTRYTISGFFKALSTTTMEVAWSYSDNQAGSIGTAIGQVDDSATFYIICYGPR